MSRSARTQQTNTVEVHHNHIGRDLILGDNTVTVTNISQDPHQQVPGMTTAAKERTKILFLTANPRGTAPLRIDTEIREIDTIIQAAPYRDSFELRRHGAVRTRDLQGIFMREAPQIVHFSGHGTGNSRLLLEDEHGNSRDVPPEALANLFTIFSDTVRCVLLNACFSEDQGFAIAESIDCVVGMSAPIDDDTAIRFARAIYQAFAHGCSVHDAFHRGCLEVGLTGDEQSVPRLLTRQGADPKRITFV